MIIACTVSVISTNGTSRRKAINGTPCSWAASTSAPGRRSYRRPSSTASPLTSAAARSATYAASRAGSSGSAMPVLSTSSPPCSSRATSASSIAWTQRTGTPRPSPPARISGRPRRTTSRSSTAASVGRTGQLPDSM